MSNGAILQAIVHLKRIEDDGWHKGCYVWIMDCCPYCGQSHHHWGGNLDGDPRSWLGKKITHCVGGELDRDYELVEAVQQATAKETRFP
jgi:hypothetical protein